MSYRSDITIDWEVSPRIITVAAPSTEVVIQDLYDTCRILESSTGAMDDPSIIDAAGKEPLGGGVSVGLTSTLQNAVLAFEARTGPSYTQCSVSGGNLVAVDFGGSPISPIHPTAFTQVLLTSSSSATLQELGAIEYASFNGGVSVDVTSSYSGTTFPVGTPEQPVNNLIDAKTIAATRGFTTLFIVGDITFGAGDDIDSFLLIGENASRTAITIEDASNANDIEIQNAYVTGYLDNGIIIRDCVVDDLNYVNGVMHQCLINPAGITLGNNATGYLLDCYSGVPGALTPVIDMGGSGQSLAIRGYSGGIKIINRTGTDPVSIDFLSGQFIADSTVTAGTIIIRGNIAKITDNSTGTAVIDYSGAMNPLVLANQVWEETSSDHTTPGTTGNDLAGARKVATNKAIISSDDTTVTIYDDDGITVLYSFDISGDQRQRLPA